MENTRIIKKLNELIEACDNLINDPDAIQRGERKVLSDRIVEFLRTSKLMSEESYVDKINSGLPSGFWMVSQDYIRKTQNMKNVLVSLKDKVELEGTEEVIKNTPTTSKQITIFIGHGRRSDWKDLLIFLGKNKFNTVEYDLEARNGVTRGETLEEILEKSNFACIVLTCEDESKDGKPHARENVIHELGLFQGKLGFEKTLMILEEGVSEPSNIQGMNQIRFKNNIRETFGDVLTELRQSS